MTFSVIIPARYQSERLPGKPLLDIAGKPMIQHVYDRASESQAERVVVATDDQRIADAVSRFGGHSCMTSANHVSGTDRLQEAASKLGLSGQDIVVNVQGDEPMLPASVIDQVATNLAVSTHRIATLCERINRIEDVFNPNIVKVARDCRSNAIYFSRAPIPWDRDEFPHDQVNLRNPGSHFRHLGIYAYRVSMLDDFVDWAPSPLEEVEKLEQLRALWYGEDILVELANQAILPGVDTPEDLQRVLDKMAR